MPSPIRWFLGLIPLAILLLVAGTMRQPAVESDLGTRGQASLASASLDWARLEIAGRDALLKGEAPAPEARLAARENAERVFGFRLVRDETTLLPEQKPFGPRSCAMALA